MNFINSILLFFAVLLIGPSILSSNENKAISNAVVLAPKDDPYAETVLMRGGTFAMGMNQESIMGEWNNNLRRVTVSSFRIDKYEVSNKKYRTYIHWLEKIFIPLGQDSIVRAALPDTSVWKTELSYNDPMVEGYFRSNAFNDYPVVGVTWEQANNYCRWRTDRANENTLIKFKLIDPKNPYVGKMGMITNTNDSSKSGSQASSNTFTTVNRGKNLDDFIMIPDFRLPTEAEWEYAAKQASQNNSSNNNKPSGGPNSSHPNASIVTTDGSFPWVNNGNDGIRNSSSSKKNGKQGMFLANFKNGSGDYMGMVGYANDGAGFPSKVNTFLQNSMGLYNISGNVNEWVADIYRPMNNVDMDDINPYRGNNALDGDDGNVSSYETGGNTLISNKSRVFKGGSWKDRPYWLNPGTRRFLDQDKSNSTIGFRCAISAFGVDSPGADNEQPWWKPKFLN
jgi:formylglycine-generating enzyme required for sulfatase activity